MCVVIILYSSSLSQSGTSEVIQWPSAPSLSKRSYERDSMNESSLGMDVIKSADGMFGFPKVKTKTANDLAEQILFGLVFLPRKIIILL